MSDLARYRSMLRETAGQKFGAKPPQPATGYMKNVTRARRS